MLDLEPPPNPYAALTIEPRQIKGINFGSLQESTPNPLISQQDTSNWFHAAYETWTDKLKQLPELIQLIQASDQERERILCGPAALGAACNSIIVDQGRGRDQFVNPVVLLTQVEQYVGQPSLDSQTNKPYPQGWQVFAKPDPEHVVTWNIRHQALALAANLDKRFTATGIRNFTIESLATSLESGVKALISVDNKIIQIANPPLNAGTHLVALIGISPDHRYIMVADPYKRDLSNTRTYTTPHWMRASAIKQYLPQTSRGVAIEAKGSNHFSVIEQYSYSLSTPISFIKDL